MAKQRYVNTRFWDDSYIIDLDPIEKLLFMYCLTNTLTSICGIYEITLKRIAFDTGIDKEMVEKILKRFEKDGRIKFKNGWLAIKNFIKHQNVNPKIEKGIELAIKNVPRELIEWIGGKPIHSLSEPLNYPNTNSNINPNTNINSKEKKIEENTKKINEIFTHWNKKDIYPHKKLTDKMKTKIRVALEEFTVEEIKKAIDNYCEINGNKKYYFDYKWPLQDFMSRGVRKFVDQADPFNNYKRGGIKKDPVKGEGFSEKVEEYDWEQ